MAYHGRMSSALQVYKREDSRHWQCSTYLGGKKRSITTRKESLERAKDFAEDWYLRLKDSSRRGEINNEKTFQHASDQFLREYEIITEGQRNPQYVQGHGRRLRMYLLPFFGKFGLSQVTAGQLQEYRIHRKERAIAERGKAAARNTLHQ